MTHTALLCASLLLGELAMKEYARPELLVEPAHLVAGDYVILDARPREQYEAGHVPGALWVNAGEWAKSFDQGQDFAGWQSRIGALGLTPDRKVVIYDDNLTKDSARMWWILRYWGFENASLLNGGWKGWLATSAEPETTVPAAPEATSPTLEPIAERLATKEQLLASLDEQSLQIIDSRSEGEFCGTEKLKNQRGGAIPGAKHLEWDDLLDAETGRFLPAEEIAALFAEAGIELDKPSATHCQSGGRASVMAFAMELMGAKQISNYYRSWHEWGNAEDTPVVPGEK